MRRICCPVCAVINYVWGQLVAEAFTNKCKRALRAANLVGGKRHLGTFYHVYHVTKMYRLAV